MVSLQRYFPKSHGRDRADDRRVLNAIIFVNRNGLRCRDTPNDDGPLQTLYNSWKRWSDKGTFLHLMEGLTTPRAPDRETIRIDATYFKAHRTTSSLGTKKGAWRMIGRAKGVIHTKLHAVSDANVRPISFFITAGRVSDYVGAAALFEPLSKAQWQLADRGYDADWLPGALRKKEILITYWAQNLGT